ncbi:glycosyltransferase [Apilactobacillus timberlakei]|nr:glycosyltransferase [Apilactobacillus timberlakei]
MIKKFLFTNENIFTFNSGTEISAINRLKMFRKNDVLSKIVTKNFDTSFIRNILKYGLNKEEVINMYDYFQGFTNIEKKHEYLRYSNIIDKNVYKIVGINNDISNIERNGNLVAKVHIFPETFGEIGEVEYYDKFMDVYSKDIYDYRGYKTKTQYFNPNGELGHEYLLDINGKPVIQITHMLADGHLKVTMIELLDYKGSNYRFKSEDELFTFFLNEISDENTIIINDRPSLIESVAKTNEKVSKYQFLHSNHLNNITNNIYDNLVPLFDDYLKLFSGIIVSTLDQKNDLNKLQNNIKIYVISDFCIMSKYNSEDYDLNNNIAYIGRIFKDKNVDDIIYVLSYIKEYLKDVHLYIVGYFESNEYKNHLFNLIKQLKLDNNITFTGYKFDSSKKEVINNSKVIIQTSLNESLGISLVEGLSFGKPEVAYDIKYGPNKIIKNRKNGYLIKPNDKKKMAKKIYKILNDNKIFYRFSKQSLIISEDFDENHVFGQWKKLFNDL